jgi:hypothetical protein
LHQVDPIVASFTGGAVGVLSMLLLVEVNNAKVRLLPASAHRSQGGAELPALAAASQGAMRVLLWNRLPAVRAVRHARQAGVT